MTEKETGVMVMYKPDLSHYTASQLAEILKNHKEVRHLVWLINNFLDQKTYDDYTTL